MKKSGILNAQLLCELTKLRHLDAMVLCDAGFPIPKNANVVDISLVAGVPDFLQTLGAILDEMIFQEYTIFSNMKEKNPEYYAIVTKTFKAQQCHEITMADFIITAQNAKLFVRTGELKPCSNIMLVSASGVPSNCIPLDTKLA